MKLVRAAQILITNPKKDDRLIEKAVQGIFVDAGCVPPRRHAARGEPETS